jgi:hypothetical protein
MTHRGRPSLAPAVHPDPPHRHGALLRRQAGLRQIGMLPRHHPGRWSDIPPDEPRRRGAEPAVAVEEQDRAGHPPIIAGMTSQRCGSAHGATSLR